MKFSILIAHYNNFEYFKDCYQSIVNQTFQDFEVVLLDDCSTDNSLEKIKELTKNDPRFKIFKNDENQGVGYTKAKLIELSSGEICAFLDPDDALTKSALQDAIKHFSEKVIVVYSRLQMCDNQLKFIKLLPRQKQIRNEWSLFFNIFFEVHHFFCFRREAYFKTEGINPNLTSAVDQDLYMKLYEVGNFKFISKPNYIYRLHNNGVSQDKSKKKKLKDNWHKVLADTLRRRNITKLYGKNVSEIENLPAFIFEKQNTIFRKLQFFMQNKNKLEMIKNEFNTLKTSVLQKIGGGKNKSSFELYLPFNGAYSL